MKIPQTQEGSIMPMQRTSTYTDGTAQKWQVDPKDIRLFVEENLRGIRHVLLKQYAIYNSKEDKPIHLFWCEDDEEAILLYTDWCTEHHKNKHEHELIPTGNTQKQKKKIKAPLVNEIGAYHILSIIEGVFSRIGYLSNIDENTINNTMYDTILVNLVITIMENQKEYGIAKGSRNEIVALVESTCLLILMSSRKGWTGNRFSQSVHEQIVSKGENKPKLFGLV